MQEDYTKNLMWNEIGLTTGQIADKIISHDSPLYPDDEDGDEYDDSIFDSKDQFFQWINETVDILLGAFENGYASIYRAIAVDSVDDIYMDDLGESWSFNRDSALIFGGRAGANVLLEAKVAIDNVNWIESVNRYLNFSSMFDADSENELVVIDSSAKALKDLKVVDLSRKKKKRPQSQIQESKKIEVLPRFSISNHWKL